MKTFQRLSPTKIIVIGYCLIILLGTVLLLLPVSTRAGETTSFMDSFFTSTSATCVTGLIRYDTYTHWTLFGQLVILALIQIGGIGFMTIAISLVSLTKRKIGLSERVLMQEAVSAPQVGGIVRMTKLILWGTLLFEGLGAIALCFYFCPMLGAMKGIYFSVFHSVSAFCNAGFDLMGCFAPGSSLITGAQNWILNLVVMLLIVVGGLGFFVWSDILHCRLRFSRYRLHTKIVICTTVLLIIAGGAMLWLFEQGGALYQGQSGSYQVMTAAFQSVTSRTAGFNTIPLGELTSPSKLLMVCLMFIGGSTGSTAGGIKTTTLAVLVLSIFTVFRRKKSVECFGRRVEEGAVRTAACVLMMYVTFTIGATLIVSYLDGLPVQEVLFESTSAIATVGLTLGITPQLSIVSQILMCLLMIFGRAGSITILLAFTSTHSTLTSKLPTEKIRIG